MAKPKKERQVQHPPSVVYFKPQGVPMVDLDQIVLNVDEYEAIRLVDYEGHDQEGAAKKLGISRPTCARIIGDAHKKIAEAITLGKAIRIEGGSYVFLKNRTRCRACGNIWEVNTKTFDDEKISCPRCSSVQCADPGKMAGGRGRGRRWAGGKGS